MKRCSECGVDVAHAKRWKDAGGHYFCDGCWHNRHQQVASDESDDLVAALESLAVSAEPPVEDEPPKMPCGQCGASVPLYQLKRTGERHLCLSCYSDFELSRQAAPDSWTTKTVKKSRADAQKQKFFTLPGLILLGVTIVAGVAALIINSQESSRRAARAARDSDGLASGTLRVTSPSSEQQQRDEATQREAARLAAQRQEETRQRVETQARKEEAEKEERKRRESERPMREALLAYAAAKVDLAKKKEYARSAEGYSQAVAENMSATGRFDQAKLNQAINDSVAALDSVHAANREAARCLEQLGTFDERALSEVARSMIADASIDTELRRAVASLMR